jgi:hypothetical protein
MGGSGSASTTRAGAGGCGAAGLGTDRPGTDEPGTSLPDVGPSAIGKSVLAVPVAAVGGAVSAPCAGVAVPAADASFASPEIGGLRPRPPFAANKGVGSGLIAPLADPAGGGCGGNPLATRCCTTGVPGRSGASGCAADACPGSGFAGEFSDCAGSPRSRAGGVSFEFTAYPLSQRHHSRHHRIQAGNRPGRRRRHQYPGVPVCDRVPNRNRPTEPRTLSGNMAKGRNRRQRMRWPSPHAQPIMEWI